MVRHSVGKETIATPAGGNGHNRQMGITTAKKLRSRLRPSRSRSERQARYSYCSRLWPLHRCQLQRLCNNRSSAQKPRCYLKSPPPPQILTSYSAFFRRRVWCSSRGLLIKKTGPGSGVGKTRNMTSVFGATVVISSSSAVSVHWSGCCRASVTDSGAKAIDVSITSNAPAAQTCYERA